MCVILINIVRNQLFLHVLFVKPEKINKHITFTCIYLADFAHVEQAECGAVQPRLTAIMLTNVLWTAN